MRVDFAQTFAQRLQTIEAFMLAQDAESAPARVEDLRDEVFRFADLVRQHPKIGRPATMLAVSSVEGKARLARVLQLAARAGLPELREYVLSGHLVLYAHSDTRVLMLSIRHQRELGYAPSAA
jgi:plasmid stabilization system protein ParE